MFCILTTVNYTCGLQFFSIWLLFTLIYIFYLKKCLRLERCEHRHTCTHRRIWCTSSESSLMSVLVQQMIRKTNKSALIWMWRQENIFYQTMAYIINSLTNSEWFSNNEHSVKTKCLIKWKPYKEIKYNLMHYFQVAGLIGVEWIIFHCNIKCVHHIIPESDERNWIDYILKSTHIFHTKMIYNLLSNPGGPGQRVSNTVPECASGYIV